MKYIKRIKGRFMDSDHYGPGQFTFLKHKWSGVYGWKKAHDFYKSFSITYNNDYANDING